MRSDECRNVEGNLSWRDADTAVNTKLWKRKENEVARAKCNAPMRWPAPCQPSTMTRTVRGSASGPATGGWLRRQTYFVCSHTGRACAPHQSLLPLTNAPAVPCAQRITFLRRQRRAVGEGIVADPRDRGQDRHRRQRRAAAEGTKADLRDRGRDRHRRQRRAVAEVHRSWPAIRGLSRKLRAGQRGGRPPLAGGLAPRSDSFYYKRRRD